MYPSSARLPNNGRGQDSASGGIEKEKQAVRPQNGRGENTSTDGGRRGRRGKLGEQRGHRPRLRHETN